MEINTTASEHHERTKRGGRASVRECVCGHKFSVSLSADGSPAPPRKVPQTWVSMRATTNHKTFGTFCVLHYPRITQP